jgi:hypothetical protein
LVLRAETTAITFATLLDYQSAAARIMWLFIRPIHVVIVRALL